MGKPFNALYGKTLQRTIVFNKWKSERHKEEPAPLHIRLKEKRKQNWSKRILSASCLKVPLSLKAKAVILVPCLSSPDCSILYVGKRNGIPREQLPRSAHRESSATADLGLHRTINTSLSSTHGYVQFTGKTLQGTMYYSTYYMGEPSTCIFF